ncbi:queuine tRNA-ribosyltransferase family protein [Candidatus Fermentibacteria bacterium]|nr:queuine tRNA-ribosyltransferase family protein [Candidatus Fermentibacteria bacterium]
MTSSLEVSHGPLTLPVFLPDATHGVVRGLDVGDLRRCRIGAIQTNVFHLMQRPGSTTVRALGGVHEMLGWNGPVITDSGGFQAYSLLRENPRYGSVSDRGLVVHPEGSRRKLLLTPEKCIQLQMAYGTDIAICLDDCTHPDDSASLQEQSVRRTIAWAQRCKAEFQKIVECRPRVVEPRPLLFAVIQGGGSLRRRQECAEALLGLGFDGFGFGGWPLGTDGRLLDDLLARVRESVPPGIPLHALGIGHPEHIATCVRMGYGLLDSVLPTRDARHGRLYTWRVERDAPLNGDWFSYLYVQDATHIKARGPVSSGCACPCCSFYSLGYLHHLYAIGDTLYQRLATMHNLHYISDLMERLRGESAMWPPVTSDPVRP